MDTQNKKSKMKLYYIAFACALMLVFSAQKAFGQQEPQYTQYMFNMLSVNPAYAGTSESLNMLLMSRIQWVGLEGAPRSHTFSAHTPINNKKIGVGASIISDNIGPVRNTYINLNYSHRVKLNESLTLALGLKAGINNFNLGLQDLRLTDETVTDQAFQHDVSNNFRPNIGTGAYLYHETFYVGFSVPKLLKTNLKANEGQVPVSQLKQHYFLAGGYVHQLNSEWRLKPSVLTKFVNGAPPSADITAQALYQDKYWLGCTYRVGDALAFLLNMQINEQLMVGYAYDVTLSGMNNISNGSHEIMVSFDFKGLTSNKIKSPRFF